MAFEAPIEGYFQSGASASYTLKLPEETPKVLRKRAKQIEKAERKRKASEKARKRAEKRRKREQEQNRRAARDALLRVAADPEKGYASVQAAQELNRMAEGR